MVDIAYVADASPGSYYAQPTYQPIRDALNMLSLRATDLPLPLPIDVVNGIATGGCVRAYGTDRMGSFRATAHAHSAKGEKHPGWVCIRSSKRLLTASGAPSRVFVHEVAHLMVPHSAGHGPRWQSVVTALGFPAEAKRYQARIAARAARKAVA